MQLQLPVNLHFQCVSLHVIAIFTAVSTMSGRHPLPLGQTGLRLICFNLSTQSEMKWGTKGKCMHGYWVTSVSLRCHFSPGQLTSSPGRWSENFSPLCVWVASLLYIFYCSESRKTSVTDVWVYDAHILLLQNKTSPLYYSTWWWAIN